MGLRALDIVEWLDIDAKYDAPLSLILGALFSAYVFMPKRRVLPYSLDPTQVGDVFLFNLLIAPVAIVVNFVASLPGAARSLLAVIKRQLNADWSRSVEETRLESLSLVREMIGKDDFNVFLDAEEGGASQDDVSQLVALLTEEKPAVEGDTEANPFLADAAEAQKGDEGGA